MKEIWLNIYGFPNHQISNFGRVKSLFYRNKKQQKILKNQLNTSGYEFVSLNYKAKCRQASIHVLVLEAFIGPRPSQNYDASHNDGNKLNNLLSNLSWKTKVENNQDKIKHGTSNKGVKSPSAKLKDEDILFIRESYVWNGPGRKSNSGELAKLFKVSRDTIILIVNRKTWTHI